MVETHGGPEILDVKEKEKNKKRSYLLNCINWLFSLRIYKHNMFVHKSDLLSDQDFKDIPYYRKYGTELGEGLIRCKLLSKSIGLYSNKAETLLSLKELQELMVVDKDIEELRKSLKAVNKFNL